MTLRIVFAAVVAIFLTGCNEDAANVAVPPPVALNDDAMGVFCGMSLTEHPVPKGQIITASRIDPFWFTSVRDTVAFTLMPDQPRDIRAIYVSDMARAASWEDPGATNWIDARKAFFVIGSRRTGGMGAAEAVPFGTRPAAAAFAATNGGKVVTSRRFRAPMSSAVIPPETRPNTPICVSIDEERPMLNRSLTRRRMIAIVATAAGSAFLVGGRAARAGDAVRWRGSALGAQVSIEIYHPDRAEAGRLVERCIQDVRRLEQQFSLYEASSAICDLNRTGILVSPDPDMVALLKASLFFADLTDGAFDPTVQPLWQLYADHFASETPDPEGPSPHEVATTLTKVGHGGLLVSADRVALVKHGAAITLNGIAQGYATDRVVDRLRNAGLSTTLVDMGEIRAIGSRPEGAPWRVGLADPDKPGALAETIDLVDRAVATSAGAGFRSTPGAGLRICSIRRQDAVRRCTVR